MDAKEGSGNFIKGFLVGATSTLPGISGGVVAVIFKIYERLIDDVSHIRTKLKEDFWFLLTVGLGILIGLVGFLYVTRYMLDTYRMATMFLFVGLIVGQLPELMRITKRGEPTKGSHMAWLSIGLAVMMILLLFELYGNEGGGEALIDSSGILTGMLLAVLAGAIFASSKIVPGISGSTVLLALGLYEWMIHIITDVDLPYLIPFSIGFIVMIFVAAKIMSHIIERHHFPLYYFIVGLTVGSAVLVTAISFDMMLSWKDVLIAAGAAGAGIMISLAFSVFRKEGKKA